MMVDNELSDVENQDKIDDERRKSRILKSHRRRLQPQCRLSVTLGEMLAAKEVRWRREEKMKEAWKN